jgi:hypothetical protein
LPTGSTGAIGWRKSSLKAQIGLHCGCRQARQIGHARATSVAGVLKKLFHKGKSHDE